MFYQVTKREWKMTNRTALEYGVSFVTFSSLSLSLPFTTELANESGVTGEFIRPRHRHLVYTRLTSLEPMHATTTATARRVLQPK